MSDNAIHLNHDEMLALIKLIFFIKFESDDAESLLYAGSASINSALAKMLQSHPFYQNRLDAFGSISPESLAWVQSKIEQDNAANPTDENTMHDLIKHCIFPYQHPKD